MSGYVRARLHVGGMDDNDARYVLMLVESAIKTIALDESKGQMVVITDVYSMHPFDAPEGAPS